MRQHRNQKFRSRIDAVRANYVHHAVALQDRPVHRIRDDVAGSVEWIVQGHHLSRAVHQLSKIAIPKLVQWCCYHRCRLAVSGRGTFVCKKEERLITAVEYLGEKNWTANASARVPLAHDRPLRWRGSKSA